MTGQQVSDLAKRYAAAWCSQHPEKVAAFYAKSASISVNGGPPTLIAEVARGFMHDFPDMVVMFDRLVKTTDGVEFHWIFTGTNTDGDGLIVESKGHFDAAEYDRQLNGQ